MARCFLQGDREKSRTREIHAGTRLPTTHVLAFLRDNASNFGLECVRELGFIIPLFAKATSNLGDLGDDGSAELFIILFAHN